ncbi:hypothetical protein EON83_00655 [bacterium]|nr:MAG: hypothetical protein EON83_00655 [bacterium]
MTSFRRVAFPLGIVAICGGALLFSLSTANGQSAPPSPSTLPGSQAPGGMPGASGMPAAAGVPAPAAGVPATTTGSPSFRQTIGVSPVQIGKKPLVVLGGTGNDTYDLQNENIYSLLREDGTPIPNVLHPLSTAKPSFILERLIVVSLTGNSSTGSSNAASGAASSSPAPSGLSGAAEGGAGAAQAPAGPTEAQKTVTAVRRVVDAELSRGTGRLGGSHRRKLQLLSSAIRSLEAANQTGAFINQALGGAGGETGAPAGGTGGTDSKLDPREILYGRARLTARQADLVTPNLP